LNWFYWQHFFLPFCPLGIATAIAGHDMFKEGGAPFIVGFNAVLSVQKQKDSSAEQRHRLSESLCLPPIGTRRSVAAVLTCA